MNEFLKSLAEAVADKLWLAPVIAIVSGVLTSLMPCSLSTIPLVIGFVGGQDLPQNGKSSRRALLLSILFAVGSTVTFCILGMLASALGGLFGTRRNRPSFCDEHIACADGTSDVGGNSNHSFRQFGAGKKPFNRRCRCVHIRNNCRIVCFALCAADSFALMAIAADAGGGNVLFGFILLLLFSAGHAVLSVAAGTSVGFVKD